MTDSTNLLDSRESGNDNSVTEFNWFTIFAKILLMKPRIGILGATGYTGSVLTKLLMGHPGVEISYLSSEQHAGKYFYDVYPNFFERINLKLKPVDLKDIASSCDVVFCATPNGFACDFVPKLLNKNNNIKVIDLSADFRLEKSIKFPKKQDLKIVYGLPEIHRAEIKTANIIANPGCYPTSAILALAPVIKNKIIDLNSIIIDSKSGVSGAGKQLKQELQFCEINESFAPYNLAGKHRHIPEIELQLRKLSGFAEKFNVIFSPHLLPVTRGILSTIYVNLIGPWRKKLAQNDVYQLYKNYFKNEYFVKVLPENIYANTKNVKHTNFCHITPIKDERTNRLILISAIDNMVKGASGQAVQNMNIILSLKEEVGLDSAGEIP